MLRGRAYGWYTLSTTWWEEPNSVAPPPLSVITPPPPPALSLFTFRHLSNVASYEENLSLQTSFSH